MSTALALALEPDDDVARFEAAVGVAHEDQLAKTGVEHRVFGTTSRRPSGLHGQRDEVPATRPPPGWRPARGSRTSRRGAADGGRAADRPTVTRPPRKTRPGRARAVTSIGCPTRGRSGAATTVAPGSRPRPHRAPCRRSRRSGPAAAGWSLRRRSDRPRELADEIPSSSRTRGRAAQAFDAKLAAGVAFAVETGLCLRPAPSSANAAYRSKATTAVRCRVAHVTVLDHRGPHADQPERARARA